MEINESGLPKKKASIHSVRIVEANSVDPTVWRKSRNQDRSDQDPSRRRKKKKGRLTRKRATLPRFEFLRARIRKQKPGQIAKLVFRLVIPLCAIVAAFFAIRLLIREGKQARDYGGTKSAPLADVLEAPFDAGVASDWKGELPVQVVDHFVNASSLQDRLKWVRNPESVRDALREYYEAGPGAIEKVKEVKPMSSLVSGTVAYDRFMICMDSGQDRMLGVILTPEGAKVDFLSYIGWCSVPWKNLLKGEADTVGEARVTISVGNYYAEPFQDDTTWKHYVTSIAGEDESLDLYVHRSSRDGVILASLTASGPARVTVSLTRSDVPTRKAKYRITRLLAAEWVVGDEPAPRG